MEQISSLLAAAAVGGFAITAVAGKLLIPVLHRLHFGQTIREEGPTWHNKKNGTPTMGGLCFILGIVATLGIVWAIFHASLPEVLGLPQLQAGLLVLFLAFGSGLIGFLDDFIKVFKHRNLGLTEAQKMILQIALTFGFMFGLNSMGLLTTVVQLPIFGTVDMGLLYYPIAFFGIIFLVNAVNLTDGLDGLCTGVTFVSMIGYLLAGSLLGFVHVSLIAAATAGACAELPGLELLPGQGLYGRYRQYVLRRHCHGAGLCDAAPRAGAVLRHCVHLGCYDGCHPACLLQGYARQAHFPYDAHPPRF